MAKLHPTAHIAKAAGMNSNDCRKKLKALGFKPVRESKTEFMVRRYWSHEAFTALMASRIPTPPPDLPSTPTPDALVTGAELGRVTPIPAPIPVGEALDIPVPAPNWGSIQRMLGLPMTGSVSLHDLQAQLNRVESLVTQLLDHATAPGAR